MRRSSGRLGPDARPFERVETECLERDQRTGPSVGRHLAEEPAKVVRLEVGSHAERAQVHIEWSSANRTEALAQVVHQAWMGAARRAQVQTEVAGEARPGEAGGETVGAAEVEQRATSGGLQQARHELAR